MARIARQQWRARIETAAARSSENRAPASPASNGGRGLKQFRTLRSNRIEPGIARQQWRARIETSSAYRSARKPTASPASNGGRGLKQVLARGIDAGHQASPASNGGRGLKPWSAWRQRRAQQGIARQQWRARIETLPRRQQAQAGSASPASNGGRGLKHINGSFSVAACAASPASNGGRGLKRGPVPCRCQTQAHRPPAMAGAD